MLNTLKKIFAIAIPAALSNFLDMLQILIDMVFIGKISPAAIAGVGIAMQVIGFLYTFISVFSVGTNSLVARFFGARSLTKGGIITYSNAVASILFSIPITVILYFSAPLFFQFFTKDIDVLSSATSYLQIVSLSFPFLFLGAVLAATANGYGNTKITLLVGILGNLLNTFLDYVLIFGNLGFPSLGVKGAAIATSVSYIFEVFVFLFIFLKLKLFKITPIFSKKLIVSSLKIGVPTSVERSIIYISFILFVWIIAQYGTYILAGYQIGLRIEGLSFMPGFGFAIAAMTLVGQSIGEKNLEKAYKMGTLTAFIAAIVMQLIGIFLFLFPEKLASIFTNDKKTLEQAIFYIKIVAISQFPLAVDFVLSGALRGAGASKLSLFVNSLSMWLFRIVPSILITLTVKEIKLVYFVMVLETYLKGFIIWLVWKSKRWRGCIAD